jgi:hypothetical protein
MVHLRRADAHALSSTVTVTAVIAVVRAASGRIRSGLHRVHVVGAVSRDAICRLRRLCCLCRLRGRIRFGQRVVGGPVCSSLHVQAQLSEVREEGGQQARGRNAAVGLMIARGNELTLQQLRDRTATRRAQRSGSGEKSDETERERVRVAVTSGTASCSDPIGKNESNARRTR